MGQLANGPDPFTPDEQLRLLAVALRVKLAREGLPTDRYFLRAGNQRPEIQSRGRAGRSAWRGRSYEGKRARGLLKR